MKKLICLSILLFASALVFGATIWLPNRAYSYGNHTKTEWIEYHGINRWNINPTSGLLTFEYDGRIYRSTIYVIED